jgi:uncharacterized protein YndB with AHSA1/START domain
MSRLEFKVSLKAPLERLWHSWTDSEDITNWFSPEAKIEPWVGGSYELYFDPANHDHQSTKGCVVTGIEPMSLLSFQWKGPDQFMDTMNTPDPVTHVSVTFTQEGENTVVSVKHEGWGLGEKWDEAKGWHLRAWKGVLADLEKYFTKGE